MIGVTLELDVDLAEQLEQALGLHRRALEQRGRVQHPALHELRVIAVMVASHHLQSPALTVGAAPHDAEHDPCGEYLTRADVAQLAGVSLPTVDRWIASGRLPSVRHSRIRRIRRSDLDEFLTARA